MKRIGFFLLAAALLFSACKPERYGDLTVTVDYEVDGADAVFNEFNFTNEAGFQYEITELLYYISDVTLTADDGSEVALANVDLLEYDGVNPNTFTLPEVPTGTYTSVSFLIGINNTLNVDGGLENTVDNDGMAWPETLGDGYHFMKFNGNYLDSTGAQAGFGMHLGVSGYQVAITLPIDLTIEKNSTATLSLMMNMNEWFRNPNTFDFYTDGAFIMPNDASRQKLSENGADVFSVK